jgi:guanosine-3',5'-bis(diphosphate) 3'-pyrophosphohydrolase
VNNAQKLAELAHLHQTRKTNGLPYIIHPTEVAGILTKAQASQDVIDAGWCHDTLEDTWVTVSILISVCGTRVASIVNDVTEEKMDPSGQKIDWKVRKLAAITALPNIPEEAQWVKCADIISNLRGLISDGVKNPDVWKAFNAERNRILWYYLSCLSNLQRVPSAMLAEGWLLYHFVNENI